MKQRGLLFTALLAYASGEPLPELGGATKMAFSFIRAQMDRDRKKYLEITEKRKEAGKRGGRPKTTDLPDSLEKATGFPEAALEANGFDAAAPKAKKADGFARKQKNPEPVSDPDPNPDPDPESNPDPTPFPDPEPKGQGQKRERRIRAFTPPTVAEVLAYCEQRGNRVDGERFVDFYAAKGWMVGKNQMKDWKAAVRTWEKQDAWRPKSGPQGTPHADGNLFLNLLREGGDGTGY